MVAKLLARIQVDMLCCAKLFENVRVEGSGGLRLPGQPQWCTSPARAAKFQNRFEGLNLFASRRV
jgi:hypothetical protein